MRPTPDPADPKGLVREAYAIPGITPAECRSVFLDWALSLPPGSDPAAPLAVLIARHAAAEPGHPMTAVLSEGLGQAAAPRRRGGRAARVPGGG